MRIGTRKLCGLGAALALGGVTVAVTAGPAGADGTAASDQLTVTALLFQSKTNNRFHVVATACRLTSVDDSTPVTCALSGTGTRTTTGGYTGSLHVASADGTVDASFALCGCGLAQGSGTERDETGANPVNLFGYLTSATTLGGVPVTDPNNLPDIERITLQVDVDDAGQPATVKAAHRTARR